MISGYRLIGGLVMGLNILGKASEYNLRTEVLTGLGVKNIHPVLGAMAKAGLYAYPVATVIEETTNKYWLSQVKEQSTIDIIDKEEPQKEAVLVELINWEETKWYGKKEV